MRSSRSIQAVVASWSASTFKASISSKLSRDTAPLGVRRPERCRQIDDRGSLRRRTYPDHQSGQYRPRSEEHTSELQSLMSRSYAVFCLKKKQQKLKTKN